jgi:hypothetical protein
LGRTKLPYNEVMNTKEEQIRILLERLGRALTTSNMKDASACWETPALVLSDQGASAFDDTANIEQMFSKAAEWYRAQGLVKTKPEIERIERLSDTLVEVDVRWPAFDEQGNEKSSERSHYIVHFGNDGQPRIQVALTRTTKVAA